MIITWVTDLINNIPTLIPYIVYGYIFLTAYYWISFKDDLGYNNILIKSVVASYILKAIFDYICSKCEYNIEGNTYIIILSLISGILGIIIGAIITHRWFNYLLQILHVGRTTNNNIWDDVIQGNTWLRVYMKDGTSYLGVFNTCESFKSEPIIVLEYYQEFDEDENLVRDLYNYENRKIMINTKDFDKIEIIYSEDNDKHIKKIKQFISDLRE